MAGIRPLSGVYRPYGKQDAGLPRRKVLRTRHEQAKEPEYVPMKYEQTALDYSAITMEMLRTQGVDMKKVAGEVIAFAKRSTLSKGYQCKPVLVGQNIAFDIGFLQQLMNYAGLAAEFEKTFPVPRTITATSSRTTSTRLSWDGWLLPLIRRLLRINWNW